jgi:hypothetical protein
MQRTLLIIQRSSPRAGTEVGPVSGLAVMRQDSKWARSSARMKRDLHHIAQLRTNDYRPANQLSNDAASSLQAVPYDFVPAKSERQTDHEAVTTVMNKSRPALSSSFHTERR